MANLAEPMGIFKTLRQRAASFAGRHPSMARRIMGLRPLGIASKSHLIEIDLGKGTRTVRTLADFATLPAAKPVPKPKKRRPPRILIPLEDRATTGPKVKILSATHANVIADVVCEIWNVMPGLLFSKSRYRREVYARFAAVRLMSERTGASSPQIGRFLDRDHTTCLTALIRAGELYRNDPHWRALYDKAGAMLDGVTT